MTMKLFALMLFVVEALVAQSTVVGSRQFNGILDTAGTTLQNVRQGASNPSTCGQNPTGSTAGAVESFLNTSTSPAILYDCSAQTPNTWVARGVPLSSVSTNKGATLLYGPVTYTNVTYPTARAQAVAFGSTVSMYTVPANRRAWSGACGVLNQSNAAVLVYENYVPSGGSGSYVLSSSNTAAVSANFVVQITGIFLDAGDSLSLSVGAGSGQLLNAACHVIEFDATVPVRSIRVLGIPAGNATVYTATRTTLLGSTSPTIGALQFVFGTPLNYAAITNDATVTTNIGYYVPAGQSLGTSTMTSNGGLGAYLRSNNVGTGETPQMAIGDSIIFTSNVASAGGMYWINVYQP